MGNSKGYEPSEESKKKVSESLKQAYAEGRRVTSDETRQKRIESMRKAWESRSRVRTEESKRKTSETLKQGYADGRIQLVGAALANSQSPFKLRTDEEKKARKLETQRILREKHPERYKHYAYEQSVAFYGWTPEQYEAEVQKQNGLCAVCKRPQQAGVRLAIDHNHDCCPEREACDKCRRGLLCTNCNTLLGSAHDSIEILASAIEYLKLHQKEKDKENGKRIYSETAS